MNIAKLKGKMAENNYNIESLSKKIGISSASLSRKLNEKSKFTVAEVNKIFEALNLTPDEAKIIFFAD